MFVRFLRRTVYDTNGPGKGPVYAEGSVHDLSPDEAERWFRRGVAVDAPPPEPAPAPDPTPDAPPPEPTRVTAQVPRRAVSMPRNAGPA